MDVTPPKLPAWSKVSIIDAGRFDAQTAYAAINTLRLDDMRPHIYRTHDGGKTWTHISEGLPDNAPVNAVREDPKRKGLLFAGTEREVYVSFDDGDHWQSLRLNMPATSMRDLIVKDDDLVVATHGRGFWILDDITPLRQLDAGVVAAEAFLFKPQVATRVRWNMNTDTPLPPDEPAGENPPDGAVIHYALKAEAPGPVDLEIFDAAGKLVRRYSSSDPVEKIDPMTTPVPSYWYRPPQVLSAAPGTHRFLWDMHYQPLSGAGGRGGLPIAAIARNTVPSPNAPWVPPGTYTVKLSVDGKILSRPLTVRMDPRVKTPAAAIAQQSALSKQLYDAILDSQAALRQVRAVRAQIKPVQEKAGPGPLFDALYAFDKKGAALEGATGGGQRGTSGGGGAGQGPGAGAGGQDTLAAVGSSMSSLMNLLQGADAAPTSQLVAAVSERMATFAVLMGKWNAFKTQELTALNAQLKAAGLPQIEIRD